MRKAVINNDKIIVKNVEKITLDGRSGAIVKFWAADFVALIL